MSKVRVIAAVLDTEELVLYVEDGSKIEIQQGDPRIKAIIDKATGPLSRKEVVEIDLEHVNDYREFEEKTSGIVKFFRVAKKFVSHIFNPDEPAPHEEPVSLGVVPVSETAAELTSTGSTAEAVTDAVQQRKPDLKTATDEIMRNAKPVSAPDYKQSDKTPDETMIATVDGKIIPGMENLQKQFAHASKMGKTEGVTNFLKRIAAVIDQRGHSIDDLLRFMEKGDLPIADDGSIVAYKVLRSKAGEPGYFVDCHTNKVKQRVGSYVVMDEKMVDPNRRNECSNGLHIARRGYLGSFSGDVIVLCKIAPEDVIAVPSYDANKVRVCGYHILNEIPKDQHQVLRGNQAMTGNVEAQRVLTAALRGQHIGRIEEVRITQGHGGGLQITPLKSVGGAKALPKAADDAKAFDDPTNKVLAVDPTKVADETLATKTKTETAPVATPAPSAPETRADKIKRLIAVLRGKGEGNTKVDAARELVSISKAAKKGLQNLGLSDADVVLVNQWKQDEPTPKATVAKTTEPKVKKAAEPKKAKPKESKKAAETVETNIPAPPKPFEEMSRAEKAKWFLSVIDSKTTDAVKRNAYQDLIDLKKKSKVGWMQLGINNFEAIQAKFEK